MAQFIPFDDEVEVNGQTMLSFVNALPLFKDDMLQVLQTYGLFNIIPEGWYPQASWLKSFKDISEKFGENTLFSIGKAIPSSAKFPPDIDSLEKALSSIDIAYHMNHRKGEIGYYKVLEFNGRMRYAILECKNPYPSIFDRGIITAIARKFMPSDSMDITVRLDENKPSRLKGDDSCTFIVEW